MKGFTLYIKPTETPNFYIVECHPAELQQPYKDGRPQPVPPYLIAEVDARTNQAVIRWSVFPERFEQIKNELEESVKNEVKEYRSANESI